MTRFKCSFFDGYEVESYIYYRFVICCITYKMLFAFKELAVIWISVKMSYHWQINWEVQKIKWTICKRIRFSPLHSIVQPVLLFLSEWTGKVVPTTSTSNALIVIFKGALGRVFCSWWNFFKSCLVLMFLNESIAGLELFFLTRR